MTGQIGNILTGSQNNVLQSVKSTQRLIDRVQLNLASGKDVNSAIDNPQNFFLSKSLSDQASDLSRLLDGISLNIRTIESAVTGAEGILKLLDQADALIDEARTELFTSRKFSAAEVSKVLDANPGVFYSEDSESFYQVVTTPQTWNNASTIAQDSELVSGGVTGIEGIKGYLAVITSQEENDAISAQVPINAWIGGSDAATEGSWYWVEGPEAGQQFWQGGPLGTAIDNSYVSWGLAAGNFEPNDLGGIEEYVEIYSSGLWNDEPAATARNYVIEWSPGRSVNSDRAAQYAEQYQQLLDQIDLLARDTQYRGIGLLNDEDLTTYFNPTLTSFLVSEGINASSNGLGLLPVDFLKLSVLNNAEKDVRDARQSVREYAGSLRVDLTVITTRFDFTKNKINIRKSGMNDLVVADQNEQGANLIALQTRQQLQSVALRLSSQSAAAVNRLF